MYQDILQDNRVIQGILQDTRIYQGILQDTKNQDTIHIINIKMFIIVQNIVRVVQKIEKHFNYNKLNIQLQNMFFIYIIQFYPKCHDEIF